MNIVITGTSRGIGLSLVKRYIEQGHFIIGCSRSESEFKHANYQHFVVDLTNEKEINNFALAVKKQYGEVDVLINNAGIASMNHFMLTPLEAAKKVMNTNFFAPFIVTRSFINALKKSNHPRIINFSTVAVPFNLDGELAYVASKAAVESMTKILAKELASFNITVNAIGPTPVKTFLTANVPPDKIQNLLNRQAIKRFGEFEDIGNVIDFYIKESSDFITGQIIYLGGVNK